MRKTLLIIDGHNLLFKAYGVPFKFYSRNGTPLHVITTFLGLVRRALKVEQFSDIAVVFDADSKNPNHLISGTYKANRKIDYSQDEDSPFRHLPFIKEVLDFLKIKVFEKRGIEADDVIASLMAKYLKENKNGKVYIASSDSDFYQLLSKRISLIHFANKGINIIFTPDSLRLKYNITPKQYVQFKCLTGDSSDNIKGIAGVGPIRASKIINKSIPFDLKKHSELLECNHRLIQLDTSLKITNKSQLALNQKILVTKNQDIFLNLGF